MPPNISELRQRISVIPTKPGVYLFKDSTGQLLYVGKAANLRNRLRTYFLKSSNPQPKIERMLQVASDFDYMVTNSESDALILENTLIKRHHPRSNTRLKDDKTYPYIKIDLSEPFPLVSFTRNFQDDNARYFGPYANAGSVRKTVNLLNKLFPFRSCTKQITGTDSRPCLEYFIHRCVAPCVGYVNQQEYRQVIDQVLLFLEGHTETVTKQLQIEMKSASSKLEFEKAAQVRDQIQAIKSVSEKQIVVSSKKFDIDVIGMVEDKDEAWIEVFFIRQGKLVGRDQFTMIETLGEKSERVLSDFIKQFYGRTSFIPPILLLQFPLPETQLIQKYLEERRGGPTKILAPSKGSRRNLVKMAVENAIQGLEAFKARRSSAQSTDNSAMMEIQEALNLPRMPQRIECYDISNIQGSNSVGSMVVFQSGRPDPKHYRRFKIQTIDSVDDYGMMREVLRRRFTRLSKSLTHSPEREVLSNNQTEVTSLSWEEVPDLVLIDGGKGHLTAGHQVFLELGISTNSIPLASLAKENEELFTPEMREPVILPRNAQGLFLLQRIRDEAHRFAITYHRQIRSKSALKSELDSVPGLGPKRKKILLAHFGTIARISQSSVNEIASLPGIPQSLARKLKELLC
jgi:excinuclease ABC subunit C